MERTMKTNDTTQQCVVDIFDDTTPLDFIQPDEGSMPISELTEAFQYSDPIQTIDACERAFGAPFALIGDWKWAATHKD